MGESPGRHELERGRPFIGPSGRMLANELQKINLTRGYVHWTNAILCECPEDDAKAAAKACQQRLRAELAAVNAQVVMPVGAWGLQGALGAAKKPQIQKWRGSVTRIGDSLVSPTIHPAFVMRLEKWRPVFELDVQRVGRLIDDGWRAPEDDPRRRLLIPKRVEALRAALAQLTPHAPISYDVETVGLGPTATLLVCFGISDGVTTIVIPWSRGRDGREPWWPMPHTVIDLVNAEFADRVVVTHNGPAFDHIVGQRYGLQIAQWEDTLLAAHALRSHLPKGLSHVATTYLDLPAWKEQEDRTADIDRLHVYNGRDCLYTILTWLEIRKELKHEYTKQQRTTPGNDDRATRPDRQGVE